MSRPARVLPDDFDPWSDAQRKLRAGYRYAKRHDDDPTPEQNDANNDYAVWRRRNPDALDPNVESAQAVEPAPAASEDAAAAVEPVPTASPRPAKPKTTAPATRPVEAEAQPVDAFALEQPPIDDAPPKVSEPTLQEQLDTARLELIECERANRHQQAELRAEIRTLQTALVATEKEHQRVRTDADTLVQAIAQRDREIAAQHKETTRISDQAAIADETIRQLELDLERERLDHRAYVDLATAKPAEPTLPEMEGGTWAKAYIFRPDETPAEPPCNHGVPAGMPTFGSPKFGYLTVTRPRSIPRRARDKKHTR